MSDTGFPVAFKKGWGRNRSGPEKVRLDPNIHAERPVEVDPRTLYDQEIEQDTRNVRLDMSFKDVIRTRDQAKLIREVMDEIIELTTRRELDDITARRWARKKVATIARTLSRLHGKVPRKPR